MHLTLEFGWSLLVDLPVLISPWLLQLFWQNLVEIYVIPFCLGAVEDTEELSFYFHFQRCVMCDVWILGISWNISCLLRFPSVLALILKMYTFVHLRSLSFFFKEKRRRSLTWLGLFCCHRGGLELLFGAKKRHEVEVSPGNDNKEVIPRFKICFCT